jgi:hypothetical protein
VPDRDAQYLLPNLTDEVDPSTGTFNFTPTLADVHKIGYAISPDCRSYVLVGIGLTEKHRTTYLFGHRISDEVTGHELPILHPGDVPPEPSPYE